MFEIIEGVKDMLSTSQVLREYLTGGIYTVRDGFISRDDTPDAFDSTGKLLPCAYITSLGDFAIQPHIHSSRNIIKIYLYQQFDFGLIALAAQQILDILHGKRFSGVYDIQYVNEVLGEDKVLDSKMIILTFEIIRLRR